MDPSEIIDVEVNGFFITTGVIQFLAKKIELLINNEILRKKLAKLAIEDSKKYDINVIYDKLLDFC